MQTPARRHAAPIVSDGTGGAAEPALLALTVAALALAVAPLLPPVARLALLAAAAGFAVARWALRRGARAHARAERYRRRLALVSRAALHLQQLRSPQDVYEEVPALLVEALGCRSARAFVPDGDALRATAVAGDAPADDEAPPLVRRAVRERRPQYDEGTPARRRERRGAASAVALPLFGDDRLIAALEVRRDGAAAFGRRDREVIEAVGRLAEEALLRLSATEALRVRGRQSDALARMSERLLLATDPASAADTALRNVLELADARWAALLAIEGDRLRPLARLGDVSPAGAAALEAGVPVEDAVLGRAWRDGRALYATDDADAEALARRDAAAVAENGAVVPVVDARGATRALLTVARDPAAAPPPSSHRSLFGSIATALGATLQRLQLEGRHRELLDVVRGLVASEDPQELYGLAVESAVRLIPGADAASILVRRGDAFRFAAGHGYTEATLRALGTFSYEDQVAWYGLSREAFGRGVPRLLRGPEVLTKTKAAATAEQVETLLRGGRVSEIRATVTVPIVAGREVLGMLNVDSFSLEDAFGDAELDLAEAFGQHVGVIIRQAQAREALTKAAVTDPVTGLGNREGFNRRLETDLARARRRHEPVHLVMMDLDGFKRINDRLGHAAGDAALQRVAEALREGLREEDGLFRWGGDEFVLLVAGGDDAAAREAARRHAEAVARIDVGGLRLSMSTGIASYPRDGADAPTLLRRADDLMYRHKHHEGAGGR